MYQAERLLSCGSRSSLDDISEIKRKITPRIDENECRNYGSFENSTSEAQPLITQDLKTLTFENLNVFVRCKSRSFFRRSTKFEERKQILKNVSGIVSPGQLVALMGASGSGKTTLLNVINSRNCRGLDVEGSIKVNGAEIGRDITSISAYVQQDDLFIGTLTVREHLIFQAVLRLPKSMKHSEKIKRADQVIFQLDLIKCRNTKIGLAGVFKGISGGEAKRLAFASEILTNPSILFCDEPTTGLDSYMAQNLVGMLQNLANTGKTILCTIHQPPSEVYAMFDRILFLAEGRIAYFGSSEGALKFFSNLEYPCPSDFNPADYYVQTLAVVPGKEEECRQRLELICNSYDTGFSHSVENTIKASNTLGIELDVRNGGSARSSKYKSSRCTQLTSLMRRSTLNNFRNPKVWYVRTVQKLVMALFAGLIYLNTTLNQEGIMNINGALFFIIAEYSFPALFGVITVLPTEFPVMVREHHNGMYPVYAYYLSKIVAFIPTYTLDGLLFIFISYFMIGLRRAFEAFLWTVLIGALLEQTSSAFGTMLSAVSPSFAIAVTIVGPIMTLIEMTGGLFLNIGTIPSYLSWAQYISWFRYGYEALFIVQWEPVTNITCANPQLSCLTNGQAILNKFNFHVENFGVDLLYMVLLYAIFHLIGYIGLTIRAYKAR